MMMRVCLVLVVFSPSILGYRIVESWGRQTIEDGPYGGEL